LNDENFDNHFFLYVSFLVKAVVKIVILKPNKIDVAKISQAVT